MCGKTKWASPSNEPPHSHNMKPNTSSDSENITLADRKKVFLLWRLQGLNLFCLTGSRSWGGCFNNKIGCLWKVKEKLYTIVSVMHNSYILVQFKPGSEYAVLAWFCNNLLNVECQWGFINDSELWDARFNSFILCSVSQWMTTDAIPVTLHDVTMKKNL